LTQTKQNYFLSQPHQPFFILGVANAVVMMLIFGLGYKGILNLEVQNLTFHVYSISFLVFLNVFVGFMFTTFGRFSQSSESISKPYYTNIFYANSLASLLFLTGGVLSHTVLILGMVIAFISQIFIVSKLHKIYKKGGSFDKSDAFWILIANYFGVLGNGLFIASELSFDIVLNSAVNITFYLYLIFLAFSVAQRMVPFFSHSFAQKNENFVKIIFVLFILKSISSAVGFKFGEMVLDVLLSVYMFMEFRRWELHPFESPAILWVLHLALFWLPLAFLLSALTLLAEMFLDTSFYFFNIHLLGLGFLTTILIGFGTRVTLGHSGQPPHADKLATNIFWLTQVVVFFRAVFSLNVGFGMGFDFLFEISLGMWIVLFLVWGYRYGKVLVFGSKVS
jgi:uncharacterized protein involved in response to NO